MEVICCQIMSNQYHLINFAKIQFKSIEKFNTYEKKAFQIQFHSSEKVDWNIRGKHSCIFKQSVCKKKPIQKKKKKKYAEFDGSFSAFCSIWNEIDDERISIQNEMFITLLANSTLYGWQIHDR